MLGAFWAVIIAMGASAERARAAPAARPAEAKSSEKGAAAATKASSLQASSQTDRPPQPGSAPATATTGPKSRLGLREGAWLVDQVGYFRTVGDRWVFVIEPAGPALVALENRNLERIARAVASYPRRLRWKVTALVTEFQGNSFILIETAVVKAEGRELRASESAHPARGVGAEKTRREESPVGPGEGKL